MTDLNTTTPPATPSDILLGRVLLWLGLIGLVTVLAIAVLAYFDRAIPDALPVALGATITGLASLLAGRRP